jgi:hypothetical protein
MAKDTKENTEVSNWLGWVYFAGFMMIIMGVFQMVAGFAALLNDKYYLVTKESLLVFDFTTWGWIHLALGLIVLMAGTAVISGQAWGRVIAVILAMVSIVVNFAFLSAYPIWSIIVMVVDVLIIYALTVHGSEAKEIK